MRILLLLLLAGCASTPPPPPCDQLCELYRTFKELGVEYDIYRMKHNVYRMCKRARGYDRKEECRELILD